MRALAVVLAGSLIAGGCSVNSYKIPTSELARLAQVAPAARGQHVRVIQDIVESDVPAAPRISGETEIVIVPQINIGASAHRAPSHSGGGGLGVGKIGGAGGDGKGAAIAFLVLAATAMLTAA